MPTNNRIFYATQLVLLNPQNGEGTPKGASGPVWYSPRAVQSLGITTNFNLTEVFSLGQLEVYDQPEDLPDIEVTMTKVFDGTPLLYTMCMAGETGADNEFPGVNGSGLTVIGNNRVNVQVGLYPDTAESAFGDPDNFISMSGMYINSFTYTFGVDDNFTEDITLVGNHKVWGAGTGSTATSHVLGFGNGNSRNVFDKDGSDEYRASVQTSRRMNLDYANSTFPEGKGGINRPSSTKNDTRTDGDKPYYQNITISSDLGREEIRQLGQFEPYYRYITFPTEVTSEFEVVASEGDYVDASDFAGEDACTSTFTQLEDKTISIKVCGVSGQVVFDLGSKNKLTSINYGGGDAGGDNVAITYSFRNFNSFSVDASGSFADGNLCLSTLGIPPTE